MFSHTLFFPLSFFPPSLPPFHRIMPNQSVTLGYLISGPVANAVKMGDFKVTSAKWCEEAK